VGCKGSDVPRCVDKVRWGLRAYQKKKKKTGPWFFFGTCLHAVQNKGVGLGAIVDNRSGTIKR